MNIQQELFKLQDKSYGDFQAKLTPGIQRETIIGVRVPELRKLAKKAVAEDNISDFLKDLPHRCYDENMLHALLISEIRDFDECVMLVECFLPFVDNWAVCDIMSPGIFKKNKTALLKKIREWSASKDTYSCRFGLEMLMTHFLDEDFEPGYLDIVAEVKSTEYYVRMMIAWFFATALAKQWDVAIRYLIEERLDIWSHNKTIQKARESFRITKEQKEYLKTLKR